MPQSRPDSEPQCPAGRATLGCAIVTYGGPGAADQLIETLRSAGVGDDLIVVVDNPAAARTLPPLQTSRVILLPTNVGYGAAMRTGIAALSKHRPDLYLLATPDLSCSSGTVRALISIATAAPGHGIIAPVLIDPRTTAVMSYGGRISPRGGASHHHVAPGPAASGVHDVDWVDGAFMLVRRAVWEAVGGIDDRFFMYYEDVDLCLRVRSAGWRVGVAEAVRVEQSPGFGRRPLAFGYLSMRNDLMVRRRHSGAGAVLSGIGGNGVRAMRGPLPGRDSAARMGRARYVAAVAAGALDFARRRHGSPPSWCSDDITGTGRGD